MLSRKFAPVQQTKNEIEFLRLTIAENIQSKQCSKELRWKLEQNITTDLYDGRKTVLRVEESAHGRRVQKYC